MDGAAWRGRSRSRASNSSWGARWLARPLRWSSWRGWRFSTAGVERCSSSGGALVLLSIVVHAVVRCVSTGSTAKRSRKPRSAGVLSDSLRQQCYAGGSIPGVVDLATVPENVLAHAAAACVDVTDPDLFRGCVVDVSCGGLAPDAEAVRFIGDPDSAVVVARDEPTTVEICCLTRQDVLPLEDRTADCLASCAATGTVALWATGREAGWSRRDSACQRPSGAYSLHSNVERFAEP